MAAKVQKRLSLWQQRYRGDRVYGSRAIEETESVSLRYRRDRVCGSKGIEETESMAAEV